MTPRPHNRQSFVAIFKAIDPLFLIPVGFVVLAIAYLALSDPGTVVNHLASTPSYPPGDPAALDYLRDMEASMNRLTSLKAIQTLRDGSGHELTTTMLYASPDRVELETSTGELSIVVSAMQWTRAQSNELWVPSHRAQPYVFPDFHDYGPTAVDVHFGGGATVNGYAARSVKFVLPTSAGPVRFEAFADLVSLRFVRVTMDAPDHHMIINYVDFSPGIAIEPPPGGQVATPKP